MTRPTKLVVDCSTGISEEIELTDEEMQERELSEQLALARRAAQAEEAEAKAEAKASAEAKLAALGLTPEEIAALR